MSDPSISPFGYDFPTSQRTQYEGREFVREANGRWFDEWRNELIQTAEGTPTIKKPDIAPYTTHSLSRWLARDIPARRWFMDQWIPLGQVVSLYGRPGSRKSTLLLQLMIASCLGRGFGPCQYLAQGPCYGLFCEDDEAEIARRSRAILLGYNAGFDQMTDCHAESLIGVTQPQFCAFKRSGTLITTPCWEKFIEDLDTIQPIFVCLDVAADFFGGNEINRSEASAFMALLDKTANERGFALILSFHPSLRGLRDATLLSGSTGWEGKARARIVIEDPSDEDTDDDNDDNANANTNRSSLRIFNRSQRRTLTLAKANYGQVGETIHLTVEDGFFLPQDLDPNNKKSIPGERAATETEFLDRLKKRLSQGRYVSPHKGNSAGYAPTALAGDGFTSRDLAAAMKRLFDNQTLRFDATKKNPSERWIISDPANQ